MISCWANISRCLYYKLLLFLLSLLSLLLLYCYYYYSSCTYILNNLSLHIEVGYVFQKLVSLVSSLGSRSDILLSQHLPVVFLGWQKLSGHYFFSFLLEVVFVQKITSISRPSLVNCWSLAMILEHGWTSVSHMLNSINLGLKFGWTCGLCGLQPTTIFDGQVLLWVSYVI